MRMFSEPSDPGFIAGESQNRPRCPGSALLPFLGGGFPTQIDYRKKGTHVLTSLLEDLEAL